MLWRHFGLLLDLMSDRVDDGCMSIQIPDVISVSSLSNLQQSTVQNKVSFAVAKKSLDVQKSQGDAAVSLLKQAADFSKGVSKGIDGFA